MRYTKGVLMSRTRYFLKEINSMPEETKAKKKQPYKRKAIKKKTGPRPKYLNANTVSIVLQAKEMGLSDARAFGVAGIPSSTQSNWYRKSLESDAPFELVDLYKKLEFATARAQQRALKVVWKVANSEAESNWKAAIKLLERCWPKEYGPPTKEDSEPERSIQVIVNLPDNGRDKH